MKKQTIRHLLEVERVVYPPTYRTMAEQDVATWSDLKAYCEAKPHIETWQGGYAVWTNTEIVDIASTTRLSLEQLRHLLRRIANTCGTETIIEADCRATTSHRLVRAAERLGYLTLIEASPYVWEGETFYEVRLRFTEKSL